MLIKQRLFSLLKETKEMRTKATLIFEEMWQLMMTGLYDHDLSERALLSDLINFREKFENDNEVVEKLYGYFQFLELPYTQVFLKSLLGSREKYLLDKHKVALIHRQGIANKLHFKFKEKYLYHPQFLCDLSDIAKNSKVTITIELKAVAVPNITVTIIGGELYPMNRDYRYQDEPFKGAELFSKSYSPQDFIGVFYPKLIEEFEQR